MTAILGIGLIIFFVGMILAVLSREASRRADDADRDGEGG